MMRVYEKAIEMNQKVAKVAGPLGRCSRELLDQTQRAVIGVPLNIAEARACLDVAAAWGCTAAREPEVVLVVDQVIGMLVNLVRTR